MLCREICLFIESIDVTSKALVRETVGEISLYDELGWA
jgi:hypothetical protein